MSCHTEHHTPDKVPAVKHTARQTILNDKNRSMQSHPSDKGADGVKDRRETPHPSPTLRHWRQLGLSVSTVGPQPCLDSRVTETSLYRRLHSNVQQSVGGRKRGVQCAARLSPHSVLTPWMGPCPPAKKKKKKGAGNGSVGHGGSTVGYEQMGCGYILHLRMHMPCYITYII